MAGPTYTYYPTVPQGATQFNLTQPQILSNFQAIYELFAVNHVNFNIPDNFGKHNFVTMEFQSDDPDGQEEEIIMFTKATGSPNVAEIFIRYPNNTTNDLVQLSVPGTPATPTGSSGGTATQGWCLFPSGLLIRWGNFAITSGSTAPTVSYTSGPTYKFTYNSSFNGISSPTKSNSKNTTGLSINGTQTTTYFKPVLYNYFSTGVTTNFNYFMMGI